MKKTITQTRSKVQTQANDLLQGLPCKLEELGTLSLIQFGSEAILRAAILEEIRSYLGRERYEHIEASGKPGYRNGDRLTTIDTPLGPVTYYRPRLAGAKDFKSNFHTPWMRRPEEFAEQVAEMYVSGVSTRKVKRVLSAAAGDKIKMSRSTVSRITERLRAEWRVWKTRDLSELKVAYLFLDAIRIGMRMGGTSKQAVMVAYAVMEDGSFETLSIDLGNSESDISWGSFLQDMKIRGLRDPLLVCSDGNVSVVKAIETHCPTSWRQRCVRHKMENILEKIPKEDQKELQSKLNRIFYGATSLEQARAFVDSFKRDYGKRFPGALSILMSDLDQCLSFYLFPHAHWKRIRTSNRLERMNLEIRRRLNVVGRHPSEEGCLSLVFQVTRRYASEQKVNSFSVTELTVKQWEKLRADKVVMAKDLLDLFNQAA